MFRQCFDLHMLFLDSKIYIYATTKRDGPYQKVSRDNCLGTNEGSTLNVYRLDVFIILIKLSSSQDKASWQIQID